MDAARNRFAAAFASGLVLVCALNAAPVGWRMDGTSAFPNASPPLEWTESRVVWKTKLPGQSFGSPVVLGDRIFIVSDPAELLCLSTDGEILWRRSHSLEDLFGAEKAAQVTTDFLLVRSERDRLRREHGKAKGDKARQKAIDKQIQAAEKLFQGLANEYPVPPAIGNRGSGNSAPTPTCDGKNVYAVFGNGIVCAYTVTGAKVWVKVIEASPAHFGHASSPVLVEGKLLVHLNDLVALSADTGEEAWRTTLSSHYASPLPMQVGTTAVVVSPAGAVVRVADGKILLKNGSLASSECTPIAKDGILYVCHGKARALRLVPAGVDAVKIEQVWESKIAGDRRTPSAVLHDGLLYNVNTAGILDVLDAETGEPAYKQRLNIGQVYASAVAAGKYIFFGGTDGKAVAIKAGKEYQEAARSKVEGFGSSPVFTGSRVYLRTRQHLYCIDKKKESD
jgi:outer membrane protein assembly factor BamB